VIVPAAHQKETLAHGGLAASGDGCCGHPSPSVRRARNQLLRLVSGVL